MGSNHCRTDTADDRGSSLIEVIVAMSLFSVLLVIFASAVTDWTKDVVRTARVSDQTSEARTIFDLFDKQVPSAVAINRPVLVGSDWYLEMRNDATTPSTCTQWRLRTGPHELAWRTWSTGLATVAATPPWRIVSRSTVNPASQPPFSMSPPDGTYGVQRLNLALSIQLGTTAAATQTVTTLAARNTGTTTVTNADADGDGISDVEVCKDIAGVRS